MPKPDLTGYIPDNSEKYISNRTNKKGVDLDFMSNRVRFDSEAKNIYLIVDDRIAYDYEQAEAESGVHPGPDELYYEKDTDGLYKTLKDLEKRFDIDFYNTPFVENQREESFAENAGKNAGKNYPYYANALSGARVTFPLGQGILDFIYFDIKKNLSALEFHTLIFNRSNVTEALGGKVRETVSVKNKDEYYDYCDQAMRDTMGASDFFYSSLYTAAFPPCFTDPNKKTYTFYLHYLAVLRKEFLEKIEFCFDKDYYPEVLGSYTPVQRYALYCEIKDIPADYSSTSEYRLNRYAPPEVMMKYFSGSLAAPESEQLKEFRKKYSLDENYRVNPSPQKLSIVTEVRSLYDMLSYEFFKMLESDMTVKKCRNCGRYFVVRGNYNAEYCDRPVEGSVRTCRAVGAEKIYKEKISSEDAWRLYKKYYKRYFARIRAGTIKDRDFRCWNGTASCKRDDCLEGMITTEEFENWLEGSFSNRVRKDKK